MPELETLDTIVIGIGLVAIVWLGLRFRGGRLPSFETLNWGTTAFILLWLAAFAMALSLVFFAPILGDLFVSSP
ncbi:MAG TPA: hypothetical protein VJX92_10165 [Methylomirabilota bacterium]|nr:hypothetical protein [Methylomirabilota bacterium]